MARLLVVDDEQAQLDLINSYFGDKHDLTLINDSTTVLEKIRGKLYDLVILDWNMPGLSGGELIKKLTVLPQFKNVPILFFSSMGFEKDTRLKGLKLGAKDFIRKPIDSAEIQVRVETFLQIKSFNDQLKDKEERLRFELEQVGKLQDAFLRHPFPKVKGITYDKLYVAAHFASGDYFDILPLPDGKFLFIMSDVTGHGASAAVVMAIARVMVREYILLTGKWGTDLPNYLNQIFKKYLPVGYFLTMFYGIYDPEEETLEYCNLGHPPVLVLRNNSFHYLESQTAPVGVFEKEIAFVKFPLVKGDRLFLYTDGLVELHDNPGYDRYEEVKKFLKENRHISLENTLANLMEHLDPGGTLIHPRNDDIAILILEYLGKND